MLTWSHLRIIANEVYRVFRQLLEEALRLENERRSVNEFRRAEALVRALPLSDRLNATYLGMFFLSGDSCADRTATPFALPQQRSKIADRTAKNGGPKPPVQ